MMIVTLQGPSGCGKSKISKLIADKFPNNKIFIIEEGPYPDGEVIKQISPDIIILEGIDPCWIEKNAKILRKLFRKKNIFSFLGF